MVTQETTFTSTGSEQIIWKSSRLKNHPGTTFSLSGAFKSIGTIESRIFFGVVCYREDGTQIQAHDSFRRLESVTIVSVIEEDGRTILVPSDPIPPTWSHNDSLSYQRALGFYLDNNIDHVPDIMHYFGDREQTVDSGAYHIDSSSRIVLNKPLSDVDLARVKEHLKNNKVTVMNHYSASTYHYGGASNVSVPREWTTYSTTYSGEGFNDVKGKLRMGTDSIEVLILANYSQGTQAILQFKDLQLTGTINAQFTL